MVGVTFFLKMQLVLDTIRVAYFFNFATCVENRLELHISIKKKKNKLKCNSQINENKEKGESQNKKKHYGKLE
jgi:hypothetical protein